MLNINEIENIFNSALQSLLTINPKVKIIFTVSPVRHLKDGFIENQQSKAHLLSAIHQFIASQKNTNPDICFYFPAYEIMLDELRDYRFYNEDMLHPNSLAIDYIWSHFTEAWLTKKAIELLKPIEVIRQGLGHKPFNESSEKHQLFIKKLEGKIASLKTKIPSLKF